MNHRRHCGWTISAASAVRTLAPDAPLHSLQATCLAEVLPRIETHAEVCFGGVRCHHRREEFTAEMVALAWLWFLRLVERGKDPLAFPTALATYAARAVKSGRRLAGQERSKDALSPLAQCKHGVKVEPLPTSTRRPFDDFYGQVHGQQELDAFEERLKDNTMTPPPDAAAFRIDFPSWLKTRTDRDRRIIEDVIQDERTLDLARRHGISPGRVSQLRREFMDDWNRFCAPPEDTPTRLPCRPPQGGPIATPGREKARPLPWSRWPRRKEVLWPVSFFWTSFI